MSIFYHSFRLAELYEAVGSNDSALLARLEQVLHPRDPDLLVCAKAIIRDGLLYHELFSQDTYNEALNKIVQVLPSHQNFFDDKDYQIDYHDAWRHLTRGSLLRQYWGYVTHGRYLFDHPIAPQTVIRYGYLTQEELPQFLHFVEQEGERLPWYFFQQSIDAIRQTQEVGDDLYVAIHIKGRRYRVIRPGETREN
ncbi:MAG TPA: hypothetical protein VFV52_14765 [Bacilli bacterium]|nr:hypothetical protein [Bacilli bacterium]